MSDLYLLLQNFAALFAESAPWLLLGLLVAGIMHELIPIELLQKHIGSNRFAAIAKAAVIGAPLPLCSCGVIPAALGLRRSGASKPTTVSFLVATPETGVDSISVSYALLGPLFAIVRPIAAIVSAIYAGLMVKIFDANETKTTPFESQQTSCCPSNDQAPEQTTGCCSTSTQNTTSCCSSEQPATGGIVDKAFAVLSFATGKLLEDITLWLLIGLTLAAAIQTWVPTDFLTQWGDGFIAMLVMALVGIPMYICATASTPIALGFLGAGLSPGAILVFMLAGPATNISTMGMIGREMGRRTLVLYLFSVVSASIILGYLLNIAVDAFGWQHLINRTEAMKVHGEGQLIYVICAVILAGLMIRNFRKWLKQYSVKTEAGCCH